MKKLLQHILVLFIFSTPIWFFSQGMSNSDDYSKLEDINRIEEMVNQKVGVYLPQLKSSSINSLQLDSMDESINYGMYWEYYKWKYNYNSNQNLLSSERKSIGDDWTNLRLTEQKTYNLYGQLSNLTKTQILSREVFPDTTLKIYNENNVYRNGNLIEQNIFASGRIYADPLTGRIILHDTLTFTNLYEYNEKNQLIKEHFYKYFSSVTFGRYKDSEYYYYPDGSLKYKVESGTVYKYETATKGDTLIKTEKYSYNSLNYAAEQFDSIVKWDVIIYDEMTFDEMGRLKTLRNSDWNIFEKKISYRFRAEFEYTSSNLLAHASYYRYINAENPTTSEEITRVNNTYDAEDNLLEYHKTFYDSHVDEWLAHEKKTYYYSSTKSVATSVNSLESFKFKIYPNPANNFIVLSEMPESGSDYRIYNLMGEKVEMGIIENSILPISHLQSGTYILELGTGEAVYRGKFMRN